MNYKAFNASLTPMVQALRLIAVLAGLATLIIMVIVGDFSILLAIVPGLFFAVLVNVPYIVAWVFAGNLRDNRTGLTILGITLTISAIVCLYTYHDVFFSDRKKDAQDGLVFVVLPVYQTGAILGASLLAKLISRFVK